MECLVNGVNVYYEIYGEGTPVVMIHGWSPDHRLMKGCMEPVFQSSFASWKRIYFDLPGMGKTKAEPWVNNSDQMLDIVLGFIDTVIPNEHFVLAGESYGGYLARGIINKRTSFVDGLLLICPVAGECGAEYQVIEKDDELLNSLTEEDRSYFEGKGINTLQNRRVWSRFKEEVLSGLKVADYTFLRKHSGDLSFDVDALEVPFTKPTLMLAGRQDSVVGYRGLWDIVELYPRASFILLDSAAHNLQIEQDILFTEAVKEWLFRVTADQGKKII